MPETGMAIAYLFALANGNTDDQAEFNSYCYEANMNPSEVISEMEVSSLDIKKFANPDDLNKDAFPLSMNVSKIFRESRHYRREILDKMALGSDKMLDLGNLYTAALPAWIAAGFEQAYEEKISIENSEILTLGYGSGDAAEVIPMRVTENWRSAAKKINFSDAMNFAIDLNKKQYFDMHEGLDSKDLDYAKKNEFVIDQVGDINRKNYQNFGIEFHRYIS